MEETRESEARERAAELREALGALKHAGVTASAIAAMLDPGETRMSKIERDELAAKMAGSSRTTMQRFVFITTVAQDPGVPEHIRELAQEGLRVIGDKPTVHGGHGQVRPVYEDVKLALADEGLAYSRPCANPGCPNRAGGRSDARYCSARCRLQAYRRSRAENPETDRSGT